MNKIPTYNNLKKIFYSNFSAFPNYGSLDELYFLLAEEYILYQKEIIGSKKLYYQMLNAIGSEGVVVQTGPGSEDVKHLALKAIAKRLLFSPTLLKVIIPNPAYF